MSKATRDTQSPAPQLPDSHDVMRVHGARAINVKDIGVEISKRRLKEFTGVSGSGESSLVFGTIGAVWLRQGKPADLVAARCTLTGEHGAADVGTGPALVRAAIEQVVELRARRRQVVFQRLCQ